MTDWLLIDASSLFFRAFFGIPKTMRAPDGRLVNAVRGFLDMLARLVSARDPRCLVVATDEDWRPAFRVEALPSYKAHRVAEPIPPELEHQVPIILDVLEAIGIEVIGADGYEAEDVIASLLPRITGTVEIVSGDRDLFALVRDPSVSVLSVQQGIGRMVVVDEREIERRYGIPGRAYGDFAIRRGDPSDGLPGLPGVGDKGAAALLRRHGSLDGVIRNARLSEADRLYLEQARRVVPPVSTIPLEPPRGVRPQAPEHPQRLQQLSREFALESPVARLMQALQVHASGTL